MNDAKSEWLTYAKTASAASEKLSAVDSKGGALVIEWKRTDILSHEI